MSIFERYRDIYALYMDANSDYFLNEVVITLTSAMQDPTMVTGLLEYLVPTPSDYLKLRVLEWKGGVVWQPMEKFPLRNKNTWGSYPRYRQQNDKLWVIGSSVMGISQIRLYYYPKQPIITVPDVDYVYGSSIALSDRGLVTYPAFCDQMQSLLYVYNAQNIQIDSISLGTSSVVLYAGASTITYLTYYAGYIYFLMGNKIYRAPYLQTGTIVPVAIVSTPTITSMSVSPQDQKLYYSDGTDIYSANLDGSSAATYQSYPGISVYDYNGAFGIYVSAGALMTTSGATLVASGVTSVTTDGTDFLWYLDTSGNVWIATIATVDSMGAAITPILSGATVIRNRVAFMGPYFMSGPVIPSSTLSVVSGRLPVVDYARDILAISSNADAEFSFPNNEADELMAYGMAIDFKRKQGADFAALDARFGEIAGRFKDIIHRDDYQPERIANVYSRGWY